MVGPIDNATAPGFSFTAALQMMTAATSGALVSPEPCCRSQTCCALFTPDEGRRSLLWVGLQAAMQRYATVHAAMFPGGSVSYNQRSLSTIPSSQSLPAPSLQQQVHWCADGSLATLAYAGPEYELYALFDTMTEKVVATQICHRLSVWIKGQQADLFMQR